MRVFNHFLYERRGFPILLTWDHEGTLKRIEIIERKCDQPTEGIYYSNSARIPHYLVRLIDAIENYFETGKPIVDIPWDCLDKNAWTLFQQNVYRATALVPHGETRSYGWVAKKIGSRQACRAVGQALRKNPFPILIPCHRIISFDGELGGFMGKKTPSDQEIQKKARLLKLEETYLNPVFSFLQ